MHPHTHTDTHHARTRTCTHTRTHGRAHELAQTQRGASIYWSPLDFNHLVPAVHHQQRWVVHWSDPPLIVKCVVPNFSVSSEFVPIGFEPSCTSRASSATLGVFWSDSQGVVRCVVPNITTSALCQYAETQAQVKGSAWCSMKCLPSCRAAVYSAARVARCTDFRHI